MADGDEKIDHNDRVHVLNRVIDAPTEVMFDGKVLAWKPGEVRSMQKDEAAQIVEKSVVVRDPTFTEPSVYKLVIVNELKEPVDAAMSAEPLTLAACKDLAKYGSLNTDHLPADRLIMGQILKDEHGNYPSRRGVLQTSGVLDRAAREQAEERQKLDREALKRELRDELLAELRADVHDPGPLPAAS